MKDCRRIDARLTPYVDNALKPEERADVEQHLDACPPCRVAAAEEQGARTVLSERAERLKATPLPPGLRTRCEALARAHAAPSRASWRTRVVPVSLSAILIVFTASALFSLATRRSDGVLAAQLTADHSKCFRLFAPPNASSVDAREVEKMLRERYGWDVHVPPSSQADGLQLIGARRCLYADGRVPHLMYRANGQDVSLYVLEGVARNGADVVTLGHEARIWSTGNTTYVLVFPRGNEQPADAVRYVMREAR